MITWANKHTSSTIVTAFWPVQVPAVVLMSWIFFHEKLSWEEYLGGFLIIIGLFAVSWGKYNQEQEKKHDYSILSEEEEKIN